jgi:hypothetical protein
MGHLEAKTDCDAIETVGTISEIMISLPILLTPVIMALYSKFGRKIG